MVFIYYIMQEEKEDSFVVQKIKNLQNVVVKLIKELTLTEKSKKVPLDARLKNLSQINLHLFEISKLSPKDVQTFADDKLIVYVRFFLIDYGNKIPPIEFFKILLVSEEVVDKLIKHSIPLYITRIIERQNLGKSMQGMFNANYEDEMQVAIRFIGCWVDRFPKKFPQILAFSLMALSELPVLQTFEEKKMDNINISTKTQLIDIMLNMAMKNTQLCCICGGFTLLINSITDPLLSDKSYQILSKMIFFINDPVNRQLTAEYIDLTKIFHYLTDLDNIFLEQGYKLRSNFEALGKFQTKLTLAKNAIITLFKSWAGVIYLGNHPQTISGMLQALKQLPRKCDSQIRVIIFDILEDILSVGDYILKASASQEKGIFRMSNLIGCYVMTVVELLIDQDLLRTLIEFSGFNDQQISQPSQRLLKRLTLLIFSFRPESSKYIDFLISSATNSKNCNQVIRTSSSFMINKIGNYIYDRKQRKNHPMFNELQNLFSLKTIFVPYLRASVNSVSKTLNFLNYREKQAYRKNMLQMNPISKQNKQNYLKWKWELIDSLLSFPDPDKFKSSANERYRQNKLYKYLLRFYSPSRGHFHRLSWSMENFLYIKCGKLMIKNSITIHQNLPLVKNPPESQFQCTVSFIGDLEKFMEILIAECIKKSIQTNLRLFTTLQSSLLGFMGEFSENKVGYESLLCENRFFQLMQSCAHIEECSHLIYIFMVNLDFYRDDARKKVLGQTQTIGPKVLLEICVEKGSKSIKLACIEILKIILKSQILQFSVFSYKILIYLLWKEPANDQIIQLITQYLEQHLCNKNTIELFLKIFVQTLSDYHSDNDNKGESVSSQEQPILTSDQKIQSSKISKKLSILKIKFSFQEVREKLTTLMITRFLSNEIGLQLVQKFYPDWLEQQFKIWHAPTHNYCVTLQSKLNKSLNFSKKKDQNFFKIHPNSNGSIEDLLFLYKLPLVLYINEDRYPLWVRQVNQKYQLFVDLDATNSYEKKRFFNRASDTLKIMLGIGTMLVDEEFQLLNNQDQKSQLSIFLSMPHRNIALNGQQMVIIESNGIQLYFVDHSKVKQGIANDPNNNKKLQLKRVIINIWVPSTEHLQELPLHLINQLNKTEKGREFISNKGYIQRASQILNDFETRTKQTKNLVQLRSTLWSLGFFGGSKEGIRVLYESGIFKMILKMASKCDILSIRGTCRYVMNMFTHSETGRSLLISNGYLVNDKCFSCYPAKISQFCKVSDKVPRKYLKDPKYWADYKALLKPMNKLQQKVFESVCLMVNSINSKNAGLNIKQIQKNSPKISFSMNLLQNVITLVSFFKYKYDCRRAIIGFFEDLIRSGQFNNEVGGKLKFYIGSSSFEDVKQ